MKKPYIVQVARDATDSGGGRVVFETSQCFIDQGYNVILITDAQCDNKVESLDIVYTPLGNKLKKWQAKNKLTKTIRHFFQILLFFLFSKACVRQLDENRVVINHNLEGNCGDIYVMHNVFNYENKIRTGIIKYFKWCNPVFLFRGIRELCFLKFARGKVIVAVSKKTLIDVIPYCSKENSLLNINNGVNPQYYSYKERNISPGKFNLIFVGHQFKAKGLQFIIESLSYLPDFIQLHIVGGAGSSSKKYIDLVESHGVSGRVHFAGTVLGKELIEMYHKADLFVLPSSYETWALVGLESMSTGLPVLMTNVGGIPEYLEDGYNGFFIKQDGKDISEKIIKLIRDENLYKEMSINARNTAIAHSWEKGAMQYLEIINEVYDNKKSGANSD
ncbi:glycosyltransferase family 4 protein [Serratia sp. DD3]|uniref:glycosyltransferase family 4 protein n=1 Tax=Serratia sp. DD3 TaxID=1410619 RepID=UPI0004DA56A1|nr:glycosyltransferase family 4 protein [Serratia sp. DD3]KEY57828.1 glycogen synthase [Serratia sp. DD3]